MTKDWVYILRCTDDSYYTGHTTILEMRLAEHEAGEGSDWTEHRLPVKLVFSQEMPEKLAHSWPSNESNDGHALRRMLS
jgi:predicted GIY-YIG superfamily endonuclease